MGVKLLSCRKHSHERIHLHFMKGITSFDFGHDHTFSGRTDFSFSGRRHRHYYSIYTSFNRGHSHLIFGYTSPPIFLPNGRHYHVFQGITTVDGNPLHNHEYRGITSL